MWKLAQEQPLSTFYNCATNSWQWKSDSSQEFVAQLKRLNSNMKLPQAISLQLIPKVDLQQHGINWSSHTLHASTPIPVDLPVLCGYYIAHNLQHQAYYD